MTWHVTCKQGGEFVEISPEDSNRDHHVRLDQQGCTHCAEGLNQDETHHCGLTTMDAEACEAQNHQGQRCWNPPTVPDRPNGCTVCRPVLIEYGTRTGIVAGA